MIPSDIAKRIETDFGAVQSAQAVAEVESFAERFRGAYGNHPGDRVLRCIVHLAAGKMSDLAHYASAALGDPRDVMLWAEYGPNDERLFDFNVPFEYSTRANAT